MSNNHSSPQRAAARLNKEERGMKVVTLDSGTQSDNNGEDQASPRPLMREIPPADEFPVEALGSLLGSAARAIHDRVQAPMAICGQSVLAAASLAVQSHADVVLPIGQGSSKPTSNFFITIAVSGERKTETDRQAGWPIRKHERALGEKYDLALPNYLNDKEAWEKARDKAKTLGKGDRAAIRAGLNNLGPPPMAPLLPMLTCEEPTYEGLYKLLVAGLPSVGIFSNEGGQFIGGHGMSDEAKLRTAAGMSKLWDGDPIKRVRGGDGASVLPGRRVALHLMVQPDVANILLQDPLLTDQGLLSRMLITAPDTAAGRRFSRPQAPATNEIIKQYGARILGILETPPSLAAGKNNELDPRALSLSGAAQELWWRFADHIEQEIRPSGPMESIRGLANKLPEHAARLAAVIALVGDLHCPEVGTTEMRAGIKLAEHYAVEALRLGDTSRISAELRLAQLLLKWLHNTWPQQFVSLPDIYQRGPNAIRDQSTAKKLVRILEEHGWLFRLPEGASIDARRRREAWIIVRA
jgi:Protein of unknown function (DUF3987)